jgi:hypothetical protein
MLGGRGSAGGCTAHPGGPRLTTQVAHTADLKPSTLRAARALLDEVSGDELTEQAWHHALGGVHVLASESGELVGVYRGAGGPGGSMMSRPVGRSDESSSSCQ